MTNITITAHSGAYNTPDNTMQYVNTAIGNNADIIEIDVRMRPNGVPAMAHDAIHSDSEGEEIEPVLLAAKGTSSLINLDIKQTDVLPVLNDMIERHGMTDRVFMTGIEEKDVPAVKASCNGIKYYLNHKPSRLKIRQKGYRQQLINLLESTGAVGINCNYKYSSTALSALMHANGYQLSLWTVDSERAVKRVIAQSPDNITTYHPDRVKSVLRKQK